MAKKSQPRDYSLQSTAPGFSIPKIKKVNTGLLNNVSDRDSQELIREVDRTCLDPELKFKQQWKALAIHAIRPTSNVENRYREKRAELKENGGGRLPQEVLGFYVCRDKNLAVRIAREGIRTNRNQSGCLGDPSQGVHLFRYLDMALLSQIMDMKTQYILVFKVLFGRAKQVPVSLDSINTVGATKEPTPNYDVHVSQSAPRVGEHNAVIYNKSQMYLYEYTDDAVPAECPRQCLPYALIEFTHVGSKAGNTHSIRSKSLSTGAANAGWSSVSRSSNEGIRKSAESFRQFTREPSSFARTIPTVQHIEPPTPPLTPSDVESLCSPQGKETSLSHRASIGSQESDPDCSARRAPEKIVDNYQPVPMDLANTPEKSVVQKDIVPPSHLRILSFKDPKLRHPSYESDQESHPDQVSADVTWRPASFATVSRDPRIRRRSAGVDLGLQPDGGRLVSKENTGVIGEPQGISSFPAKNVMATISRLWGGGNSLPAEHSVTQETVEKDPMDSWGLTWNGNDENEQNENVCSSQGGVVYQEKQHTMYSSNQHNRPVTIRRQFDQERTFNKTLFERRSSEPSASLLSEKDLASLCQPSDNQNISKKLPSIPSLNRTPIKSALKKPSVSPAQSEAEGRKKKTLSFQDYLKKKKAEANVSTEASQPSETSLLVSSEGSSEKRNTVTMPEESIREGTSLETCQEPHPNSSTEVVAGSSPSPSCMGNADSENLWLKPCSSNPETLEQQPTMATQENAIIQSSLNAKKSVPTTAYHNLFKILSKKDPRLHSAGRSESAFKCKPDQAVNEQSGKKATTASAESLDSNHESLAGSESVTCITDSSRWEQDTEKASTEKQKLHCKDGAEDGAKKDAVEASSVSRLPEMDNHQVLFADIPEDIDNENALCVSLDENHSEEKSKENEMRTVSRDGAIGSALIPCGSEKRPERTVSNETKGEASDSVDHASEKIVLEKEVDSTPKSLSPSLPSLEQLTSASKADEEMAQLLRIAKGLRGKPVASAAEDRKNERNISPSSDSSSRKSRNVSPSSDSSAQSTGLSAEQSSTESTPDPFKSILIKFSSAASSETDECDKTSVTGQPSVVTKAGSKKKKKAKDKQEKNAIETSALESNVDPYALLRLSKGLRPGKSIHVGGLGKNPTDDPLPVLENTKRKRKTQTKAKKGNQETAAKVERSAQQSQLTTERKVKKRRRNTCTSGKRRTKKKKGTQANSNPLVEDDIDYTDFQFEEPQDFCMSICDEMEAVSNDSNSHSQDAASVCPSPGSATLETEPGETACKESSGALPLSYLGLSHWTEALLQPRLDPQVALVDLFKAFQGQADFENCAICRKVIDSAMVEDENQAEDKTTSTNAAESSLLKEKKGQNETEQSLSIPLPCLGAVIVKREPLSPVSEQKKWDVLPERITDGIESSSSSGAAMTEVGKGVESEKERELPDMTSLQSRRHPSPERNRGFSSESETDEMGNKVNNKQARLAFVHEGESTLPEPSTEKVISLSSSLPEAADKGEDKENRRSETAFTQRSRDPSPDEKRNKTKHLSSLPETSEENELQNGTFGAVFGQRNISPSCEMSQKNCSSESSESAETTTEKNRGEAGNGQCKMSCTQKNIHITDDQNKSKCLSSSKDAGEETEQEDRPTDSLQDVSVKDISATCPPVRQDCSFSTKNIKLGSENLLPSMKVSAVQNVTKDMCSTQQRTFQDAQNSAALTKSLVQEPTTEFPPKVGGNCNGPATNNEKEKGGAIGETHFQICNQEEMCEPTSRSNLQSASPQAELTKLNLQASRKLPSLGTPKRSHSADEAVSVSNQNLAPSEQVKDLSANNTSFKVRAPSAVFSHRSPHPRPSFTVCSQGSKRQCWQRWKNSQVQRMQDKTVSDTEIDSPVIDLSYAENDREVSFHRSHLMGSESEGYSQSDISDNEANRNTLPFSSNHDARRTFIAVSAETKTDDQNTYHNVNSDHPIRTTQNKPGLESGFWLGIDELKTLQQTTENVAGTHGQDICSKAATKLSPTKLSQLLPVATVQDKNRSPSSRLVEQRGLSALNIPLVGKVGEKDSVKFSPQKITREPYTDSTNFFEMVIRESGGSEVSSESGIPGLDLVNPSKPQNTDQNVQCWKTKTNSFQELEVTRKASKELLMDEYHESEASFDKSSDGSVAHFKESKGGEHLEKNEGKSEEHSKENKKEDGIGLNKRTRDIVYSGEDLDVLGTPSPDSDGLEIRKKHVSFQCRSLERKVIASVENVVAEDSVDKDNGQLQLNQTKTSENFTVVSKERILTGCPIPSFTSSRSNQKNKKEQIKIQQKASDLPTTVSMEPQSTIATLNSSFSDVVPPQGAEATPVFSSMGEPPVPGTEPQICPEVISVQPLNHSMPCSRFSPGYAVGQPLYQQCMSLGPVLVPEVPTVNTPVPVVNTPVPMTVPVPMLSSGPIPVLRSDQSFVYPRQPVPVPPPMVQHLFTKPPPPLPNAISMQPLPPGTAMQGESSVMDPKPQPFPVSSQSNVMRGDPSSGRASVLNTMSSASRTTSETASVTGTTGTVDVIGWFAEREAQVKNPPKKDMIDWFSDILDGKRNASSVSESEPELKKARLDFIDSLSHKGNRSRDFEEKSKEMGSALKKGSIPFDSDDRDSTAIRNKRTNPSSVEDKPSTKKLKGNLEASRISFRVEYSSDAKSRKFGLLRRSVNFDSDSDSDGSVKSHKETAKEHEESRKESSNGRRPTRGTSEKVTENVKDSKKCDTVVNEKERHQTENSNSATEKKESFSSRRGTDRGDRKVRSRWDKRDSGAKDPKPRNTDTDDEMNDYAHALLEENSSSNSLQRISNNISTSILKSLSSVPKDLNVSGNISNSKNLSSASEEKSSHTQTQNQSNSEKTKPNLTDKPMEFLLFAKEMIMKKLEEDGSGLSKSPVSHDPPSSVCTTDSGLSVPPVTSTQSTTCTSVLNRSKAVDSYKGQSVSDVESSGCNQKTNLGSDSDIIAHSSTKPSDTPAANTSAISEEEISALKDLVCQLLPGSTAREKFEDTPFHFTSSEKVRNERKRSSAGRDWSRFLMTSRPYRRISSGGSEKNYYGDLLEAPYAIDDIRPQSERCKPHSSTSKIDFFPNVAATSGTVTKTLSHASATAPLFTVASSTVVSKPSTQANSAVASESLAQVNSSAALKSSTQGKSVVAPKSSSQVNSSAALKSPTQAKPVVAPKSSSQVNSSAALKSSSQGKPVVAPKSSSQVNSSAALKSSTQGKSVVAPKSSSQVNSSAALKSSSQAKPVVAPKSSSQVNSSAALKSSSQGKSVVAPKSSSQVNSSAALKSSSQGKSVVASKSSSQVNSSAAFKSTTQTSVTTASKPSSHANGAAVAKPTTVTNITTAAKPSTKTDLASVPKPQKQVNSASPQKSATEISLSVQEKSVSCSATQSTAVKSSTSTGVSVQITSVSVCPVTQAAAAALQTKTTTQTVSAVEHEVSAKRNTDAVLVQEQYSLGEPKPSTSTSNASSNPSIQGETLAQSDGTQACVKTLEMLLREKFPDADPNEFAPILSHELSSDVTKMSNKAIKNVMFKVRKHLECGAFIPPPPEPQTPKALLLEEFAVDQIELELRLVEGCQRLLEATRAVKRTPGEAQTRTSRKRSNRPDDPHEVSMISSALTVVIRDFSSAMEDSKRDWKGRPHQRLPSDLLLSSEQGELYTKEGVFVMLVSTIPCKPFKRLKQLRTDIESCVTIIGHSACQNETQVLIHEKQRLQQLHLQRQQLMRTFTGAVNSTRLKKLMYYEDHYLTSQKHLLEVLGIENVAKMVFFRASFKAIENHLKIVQGESPSK